jgi:hypothetical protein
MFGVGHVVEAQHDPFQPGHAEEQPDPGERDQQHDEQRHDQLPTRSRRISSLPRGS